MEELDNLTQEALTRYFTVLEKTGYVKDADVNKLLLLLFLQEFVRNYQSYITEADYNIISKIISCLSGSSCLIPYKQYKQLSIPIEDFVSSAIVIKITTDNITRSTEPEFGLRLVNL